ncbi:MAG: C40 family peptidase, partial [Muribaculaceae bacterium]|nr:C40 family peptidase [Muribaculaceae bacterium]
ELFREVYDIKLPRSSAAQQEFCIGVSRQDLQPGDLVFFATTKRKNVVSHVGLYIGAGRMIHASGSRGVMESGLDEAYFQRNWHSGGRVLQPTSVRPEEPAIPDRSAPALPAVTALDSLELIIEQQIDSIYVSDPEIFD